MTAGGFDSYDFGFDQRANRLREWEIREDPHRLLLCADNAVFQQIRRFIARSGQVINIAPFPEAEASRWTHCLELTRIPEGLRDFLRLMESVVVLRGLPQEISDAIALDFYKIPRPDLDPDSWPNTDIGELVNRMKYWKTDPVAQASAREGLTDRLASVVRRHPLLRDSQLVSTPGHNATRTSQSELLGQAVATRLGVSILRTRSRNLLRPESKARTERVDFRDEFEIDRGQLAGAEVVIIDDVLGRGTTMQGVAAAARRAGAPYDGIHALVAARTIR